MCTAGHASSMVKVIEFYRALVKRLRVVQIELQENYAGFAKQIRASGGFQNGCWR